MRSRIDGADSTVVDVKDADEQVGAIESDADAAAVAFVRRLCVSNSSTSASTAIKAAVCAAWARGGKLPSAVPMAVWCSL